MITAGGVIKSTSKDNNFNMLRMLAASAVLISHSYPLALGQGTQEPLESTLGISLGTLAVLTFFAISGYFISQSFNLKPSIAEFVVARAMRIYPALLAVLLLTVLVLGPAVTALHLRTYFSDSETLLYVPRNLRLWPLHYELPGVFADNPYPRAINGSLWTLAYEVACYALVVLVGTVSRGHRLGRFSSFLLIYFATYIVSIPLIRSHEELAVLRAIHILSLPFVIGMALFVFRLYVPLRLSVLLVFAAATFLARKTPWFNEALVFSWSYGVFYLGFFNYKPLLMYNRLGDYSYGTYIYAFPIEQTIAAFCKGCQPTTMITLALPLTLFFAVLSWHAVETYGLSWKSAVSACLTAMCRRITWLVAGLPTT
jgi:peptidoglycan/LPS O-acetylase OafA/YrhL